MTMFNETLLAGKVAMVTGSSSGLGRHFALTLARHGARVVCAARRLDKLEEVIDEIVDAGGEAEAVVMDVTDRQSIIHAYDAAANTFGPPTILINNAGMASTEKALDVTPESWNRTIDTNLTGAWQVALENARRLVEAGTGGSIVNISSILGLRVAGGVAPYAVSKAGLVQLTKVLALEWARYGIRVNALAPGYIETDLNRGFLEGDAGQSLKKRVPQRRFGVPEDLEGALLLLASDAGSYINGHTLAVDGGHLVSSL